VNRIPLAAAAIAAAVCAAPAHAQEGPLLVRVRALDMINDNRNSTTALVPAVTQGKVEVENKWFPEVDFTWFLSRNLAAELILTYPQRHDVKLGGAKIGTAKHLPPTLTLQYHFMPESSVRPYVGAGINYTRFMQVDLDAGRAPQLGGAGGIPVDVKRNSVGAAGQVGVDIKAGDRWYFNLDAKYVKISTEVKVKDSVATLGGARVTDLDIDPWLLSVGIGYRF
jgi:outer membrane protein